MSAATAKNTVAFIGWLLWKGHERIGDSTPSGCTGGKRRPTLCASQAASHFEEDPSLPRAFVLKNEEFADVSHNLAQQLSLPLFTEDELLGQNDDSLSLSSRSSSQLHLPPYVLIIHPYEFQVFGTTTVVQNYALALQSIPSFPLTKRQVRRKSKHIWSTFPTKPFWIDFCPPSSPRNSNSAMGATTDLLVKAVSPKDANILDLTAGLGQDASVLARAGARRVFMVERDPIIAALLQDALRRLELVSEYDPEAHKLSTRMDFQWGDGVSVARQWLARLTDDNDDDDDDDENIDAPNVNFGRPDIVYLDPMFPARKKSASVKKNMQLLHGLLESQTVDDQIRLEREATLLQCAIAIAKRKVVVKRPIHAPYLGSTGESQNNNSNDNNDKLPDSQSLPKPSYDICGSINRWDIYVKSSSTSDE